MKLHDQEILPLFSNPFYKARAKYYVNDVIDFDNINETLFFQKEVNLDIEEENCGKILISKNQNILLDDKFINIKKYCDAAVKDFAYENLKVNEDITFKVCSSWLIVGYPGSITNTHLHQNSVFSGVFYIKTKPNSGNICLTHPNIIPTAFSSTLQPTIEEYNILNSRMFVYTPKDNDIIIFPSHVSHNITRNNSNEIRCCIAFNYFAEGNISQSDTENLNIKVL